MQRNPDAEDARDLQRDWRRRMERRADEGDENHAQTALILERCINRLDEHDRRITALEERPEKQQAQRVGILGAASNTVYTLVAIAALGFDAFTTVLALASTAIAVIALIHH